MAVPEIREEGKAEKERESEIWIQLPELIAPLASLPIPSTPLVRREYSAYSYSSHQIV